MVSIAHRLLRRCEHGLTPICARFIKRACTGKNEGFDSTRRMRDETPLARPAMQPRRCVPCRSQGQIGDLSGNVCVNAQPPVDLLKEFRISSQTAYGVWAYRLMSNENHIG